MRQQLVVGLVVVPLDGHVLDRPVHSLDLTVARLFRLNQSRAQGG